VPRVIRARIESRPLPGPFRYKISAAWPPSPQGGIAELGPLKLWGMPAWWMCGARSTSRSCRARQKSLRRDVRLAWAYLRTGAASADYGAEADTLTGEAKSVATV